MSAWWNKWVGEKDGEPRVEYLSTEESGSKHSGSGWLARWHAPKRQEQQLATLREGFSELVGLTRAIREHMEQQARTQQTLVDMMDHLPGAVEGLKNVGRATEQQTETLALLKEQLESSARNEGHLAESMQQFNKTLAVMDDLSKSTSRTVTSMVERTHRSEETLQKILERSERRVLHMTITLWGLILAGIIAVLHFGFDLWGGAPADDPVPDAVEEMRAPAVEPAEPESPGLEVPGENIE